MEPLYRQRLIGAMVLVAVAVVIVPLLLGEPRPVREGAGVEVNVPEPPHFETPSSPEQEAVVAMDAPSAFPEEDLVPPAPSAESLEAWLNPAAEAGAEPRSPPLPDTTAAAKAPEPLGTADATPAPPAPDAGSRPSADAAGAALPRLAAVAPAAPGAAPGPDSGGGVWVVQVGSFTGLDNARRRVEQLQARAFEAWVAEPERPGGPYRVWVGPELDRARANELQARIARELKLDAQVKRHVSP